MYLRKCRRQVGGEQKDYWQLVESYRTERGPRQRVVCHLGDLEEAARIGVKEAASGNSEHIRQRELFGDVEPRWVGVDVSRVKVERTAFRITKNELSIRPIWHQKAERVQAHILVCFLAYVLWKTLGQMCQRAGLGDEPRKVFDEIAQVQMMDVVLPTKGGPSMRRRCVAQPTKHQAILLQRLGLTLPTQMKIYEM